MNGNEVIEEKRQRETWRLFGKRRKDKAKTMLFINVLAAVAMVVVRYLIG
jgi:hypothetical protein